VSGSGISQAASSAAAVFAETFPVFADVAAFCGTVALFLAMAWFVRGVIEERELSLVTAK